MNIADRIGEILSEILSDKYNADIKVTLKPKEETDHEAHEG